MKKQRSKFVKSIRESSKILNDSHIVNSNLNEKKAKERLANSICSQATAMSESIYNGMLEMSEDMYDKLKDNANDIGEK